MSTSAQPERSAPDSSVPDGSVLDGSPAAPALPDYSLAEVEVVTDPSVVKAIFDPLRGTLLELLLERAASVQELAAAVDRHRRAVGDHDVAVWVEQENVEVPEARGRLAEVRRRRLPLEVAAHHHRAHPDRAQRLRIDELRLPIEPPNRLRVHERHRVPKREAAGGERLDRLVARPPPRLAGELRGRDYQGAGACRVLVEPLPGRDPVLGHLPPRALRQQAQRPRRRHRHCGGKGDADNLGAVHVRGQVPGAERERQMDQGVEFVQVAEGGESTVVKRRAHVRRAEHPEPHREHRKQRPAPRHVAARQAREPERGDEAGGDDERRLRHQQVASGALRVHERGPAGGAAQDLHRVEPRGGHAGGLDEVRERRGVAAQH